MKVTLIALFAFGLLILGCDTWEQLRERLGIASVGRLVPITEPKAGRFALLHTTTRLPSGEDTAVVLRIDTATGETWKLNIQSNRWVGVKDDLKPTLKYNEKTKTLERGVALPDGRDLSELSNDELIRYLQRSLAPNDPFSTKNAGIESNLKRSPPGATTPPKTAEEFIRGLGK